MPPPPPVEQPVAAVPCVLGLRDLDPGILDPGPGSGFIVSKSDGFGTQAARHSQGARQLANYYRDPGSQAQTAQIAHRAPII